MLNRLKLFNNTYFPGQLWHDPEWIVLGVNNLCNLHCKMCDVGVGHTTSNFYQNMMGSQPLHMPMELIKKTCDELALNFTKTKLGFAFTEPSVYKHLAEALAYAQQKKIFTSLTTNALNLRKIADMLIDNSLDELYVSLDGPAKIHNEIRGYHQSFERAIEGIDYLLSKDNGPSISIFCAITQWNIGYLQEFLNYFKGKRLKQIGFMHTNFTSSEQAQLHNAQYQLSYPADLSCATDIDLNAYNLELLWKEIQCIKASNYSFPISFSPDIKFESSLKKYYLQTELKFGKRCHDIFNMMMIKSNGDVLPAHSRCYNLKIGNVYQNSIKEIWNSEIVSTFRKDVTRAGGLLPACHRCCSALSE
jgi:Fe-coproporphyrin III synthase